MIGYLKGNVTEKFENSIFIEVNGVGFKVTIPLCDLNDIKENSDIKVYTYMHIREDILDLYGSTNKGTIEIFKKLIDVSGIGPKVAINVLSKITVAELVRSIITSDATSLSTCPGIGKKTAERMILELKDKFSSIQGEVFSGSSGDISAGGMSVKDEAIEALINLGYKKQDAKKIVEKVYKKDMNLEDLIRNSLKG